MNRVTRATLDPQGLFKDANNNRYKVTSGLYTEAEISSMSDVWAPQPTETGIELGPVANPSSSVAVQYYDASQALAWLGLTYA